MSGCETAVALYITEIHLYDITHLFILPCITGLMIVLHALGRTFSSKWCKRTLLLANLVRTYLILIHILWQHRHGVGHRWWHSFDIIPCKIGAVFKHTPWERGRCGTAACPFPSIPPNRSHLPFPAYLPAIPVLPQAKWFSDSWTCLALARSSCMTPTQRVSLLPREAVCRYLIEMPIGYQLFGIPIRNRYQIGIWYFNSNAFGILLALRTLTNVGMRGW